MKIFVVLFLIVIGLSLPFLIKFAPVEIPGLTANAADEVPTVPCLFDTPSANPNDECAGLAGCFEQDPSLPAADAQKLRDECYYKWKQDKCEAKKHEGYVYVASFNHSCVTVISFVTTLINYLLMFSSIIAGFMFLQSGYRILTSQGNPTAIAEGRSQLTSALVGMILIATSFVIINFLNGAFGTLNAGIDLIGPFTQESQK